MEQVNFFAVFVAAAVSFVVGGVWYSPFVFGKIWMKLIGKKKQYLQKGVYGIYLLGFLVNFFMAFMLAQYFQFLHLQGAWNGTFQGFCVGIGFVATNSLLDTLFSGKSVKLYFINTLHQVTNLTLIGAILGAAWS
jgi:hypothetical protein